MTRNKIAQDAMPNRNTRHNTKTDRLTVGASRPPLVHPRFACAAQIRSTLRCCGLCRYRCRLTKHPLTFCAFRADAARPGVMKKKGAGKGNWGKAGEELSLDVALDEHDPAYDSADELYSRAFGTSPPSGFSWNQVNDISEDDNEAMNEIEAVMMSDWLSEQFKEAAGIQDEAEEFFNKAA